MIAIYHSNKVFWLRFIAIVMAFASLQGCDACRSSFSQVAGSGDGRPIEGKPDAGTYYRVVPGFTCSNQPHIHSQIEVSETAIVARSFNASDCASTVTPVVSIEHSPLSPSLIGYGAGIFEKQVVAPDPSVAVGAQPETWCRSLVKDGSILDVTIRQDPVSFGFSAEVKGAFLSASGWQVSPTEIQAVSQAGIGSKMSYASPTVDLQVDREASVGGGLVGGSIKIVYASRDLELKLQCRNGQKFDPLAPIKPTLALDFLSGALPSSLSFSRAGAATYFNSTGQLAVAPPHVPRFDHDPTTLKPAGLLVEEERTNLLLSAADLTNGAWTNNGIGVYRNGSIAGLDSFKIIKDNGGTLEYWRRSLQTVTLTPGQTYTASFLARKGNINSAKFTIWQNSTDEAEIDFDLNSGTSVIAYQNVVSVTGRSITPVGSAYRVSVTFIPTTALLDVGIGPGTTSLNDFIYATGAQLELGAGPSSLILTTNAPQTRGEDVPRLDDMSWYSSARGTFQLGVSRLGFETAGATGVAEAFSLKNSGSDRQRVRFDIATGLYHADVSVGPSSSDIQASASVRPGAFASQDLILAYEAGAATFQLNGVATHDPGMTPVGLTPNALIIGGQSLVKWNAHVRSLVFWQTKFDDTTLSRMTR